MRNKRATVRCPSVAGEFAGLRLPDRRLDKRLRIVTESLCAAPDQGFPRVAGSDGQLEAMYRFFGNSRIRAQALMEAHFEQTAKRAESEGTVLVAHDTTELEFPGEAERDGLGFLRPKSRGFLLHAALSVSTSGTRRPLGLLGAQTLVRTALRRKRNGRRLSGPEYSEVTEKESKRWAELVTDCEERCGARVSLIHVMDREADAYPLLAMMFEQHMRFVVRLTRDRLLWNDRDEPREKLSEALGQAEDVLEFAVPVSRRRGSSAPRARRTHAPRDSRIAQLRLSTTIVQLKRPRYFSDASELPECVPVRIVRAYEVNAPEGTKPVEWILATSEPTQTREQLLRVLEHYRCRWQIEEYFKALKTGCAFERRQLESYDALLRALAVFLPIAWQLLLIRNLARTSPDAPATSALNPTQIQVLREFSSYKMPANPTAQDALLSVAALGGHIRNNGQPGWSILGGGMERLLLLEAGWNAARKGGKFSDQS